MHTRWLTAGALTLACFAVGAADESSIVLKEDADAALTRARCSICHSADYIQMNSVFLNRAAWNAEVRKMIKVMGAPVTEEEEAIIVAYLARYYGVD